MESRAEQSRTSNHESSSCSGIVKIELVGGGTSYDDCYCPIIVLYDLVSIVIVAGGT